MVASGFSRNRPLSFRSRLAHPQRRTALQMRVFIYPEGTVFRPEFTKSPPQILRRGVIELQFNQTSDLHTFDSQGTSFDP
jgi:hypothetical protein